MADLVLQTRMQKRGFEVRGSGTLRADIPTHKFTNYVTRRVSFAELRGNHYALMFLLYRRRDSSVIRSYYNSLIPKMKFFLCIKVPAIDPLSKYCSVPSP